MSPITVAFIIWIVPALLGELGLTAAGSYFHRRGKSPRDAFGGIHERDVAVFIALWPLVLIALIASSPFWLASRFGDWLARRP